MSEGARLKATVYVGGLDQAVDRRTLMDAFLPFGEVADVSLPKSEAPSELHKGFGYVEFENPGDAREAIENMDQSEIFGKVIKVAAAKPQKDSNAGLGSKVAVWEQEGWLAKNASKEEDAPGPEGSTADDAKSGDPMQGLEKLDVAGPQPE